MEIKCQKLSKIKFSLLRKVCFDKLPPYTLQFFSLSLTILLSSAICFPLPCSVVYYEISSNTFSTLYQALLFYKLFCLNVNFDTFSYHLFIFRPVTFHMYEKIDKSHAAAQNYSDPWIHSACKKDINRWLTPWNKMADHSLLHCRNHLNKSIPFLNTTCARIVVGAWLILIVKWNCSLFMRSKSHILRYTNRKLLYAIFAFYLFFLKVTCL